MRLFYQNGGGDAYIVSVGTYGAGSGKPVTDPAAQVVNPNVKLADLQRGLALLKNEQDPTMYLCPDATLMSLADNAILNPEMLQQAAVMGTAVCLLDIIGGAQPDPVQSSSKGHRTDRSMLLHADSSKNICWLSDIYYF